MKYLYFTTPREINTIRKNGIQKESITVIPWDGTPDQKWGMIKKSSRWLRGKSVGMVIDVTEDKYALETYIRFDTRFQSRDVALRFYGSLKSDPIDEITVSSDDHSYSMKVASEGWGSSLRILVGNDRAMELLVGRVGDNGGVEVVVRELLGVC